MSDGLTRWSHKLETHLPGSLTELVAWLMTAENLLHSSVSLRRSDPVATLASLEQLEKRHIVRPYN